MDFQNRWLDYLRSSSRQDQPPPDGPSPKCPLCHKGVRGDLEEYKQHVANDPEGHPDLTTEEAISRTFVSLSRSGKPSRQGQQQQPPQPDEQQSPPRSATRKRPVSGHDGQGSPTTQADSPEAVRSGAGADPDDYSYRDAKRPRSPPEASSVDLEPASSPHPSASGPRGRGRSKAQAQSQAQTQAEAGDSSQPHKNTKNRQLWSPDDAAPASASRPPPHAPHDASSSAAGPSRQQQYQAASSSRQPPPPDTIEDEPPAPMMSQPHTRPISHDQLVAEVKGIYAGLVMVETKCIEVDNAQSSNRDSNSKLNNEQWQALIALHRTLLHEHHDFFLASQHPSASEPLKRLAAKYAMPARMWRHGIHSFLELLRHRLPASLEHMLTFLYLAYSMMALLYETVPAFEETWIECLGDLGRYRMAIEDDDIRDREVWTGVSRHWYSKASDKSPKVGRLYHHLAILARPNALQQLYYYTKSLCVPTPFLSARESVMTLFDPLLSPNSTRLAPIDAAFVRVHGILFSGKAKEKLQDSMEEFLGLLDSHISRTTKRWLEAGYFISIALKCSLLGYGAESNVLMRAMARRPEETDVSMEGSLIDEPQADETFEIALTFTVRTWNVIVRRWGDTNTLPFIHATMVFLEHLARHPAAMAHMESEFPWKLTSAMLNYLWNSCDFEPRVDGDFPRSEKEEPPRPLPEDYALRELIYAEEYHPEDWFTNKQIDEEEKYFELASLVDQRKERILWLGHKIATHGKWLTVDDEARSFGVASKYEVDLDDVPIISTEP